MTTSLRCAEGTAETHLPPHPAAAGAAYVRFTHRLPLVQPFTPEESEDRLYNLVSDYLRRDNLQALPASQRSLMTLVLRKLLASSTFAIAGALDSMSQAASSPPQEAASQPNRSRRTESGLRSTRRNGRRMAGGRPAAEPLSEEDRAAIAAGNCRP